MARVLRRYIEPPRDCVYLPAERASLENRVMLDVTPQEFEAMLMRGWRRFGPFFFRPACAACSECLSIRVPVERFRPSQAQRRAWKKGSAGLRVELSSPMVDERRLSLYARWHAMREEDRGWAPSVQDEESYTLEFAYPQPFARELTYWDDAAPGGPRLVGVGLCDQTPQAFSAIYFFYDPDYMRWSPGVFNVLYQIDLARSLGIPHLYLGFRVAGCESMKYKATFRPHQLMRGRPGPGEPPPWGDDEGG
jgi:leucyl-tRNA---protein transferase